MDVNDSTKTQKEVRSRIEIAFITLEETQIIVNRPLVEIRGHRGTAGKGSEENGEDVTKWGKKGILGV